MAREFIAALLAAAAMLPATVAAQDRGGDRGRRFDQSARPQGGGWQQGQAGDADAMRRAQQQAPTRNWRPIRPSQGIDAPRPRPEAAQGRPRGGRLNGAGWNGGSWSGQARPDRNAFRNDRRYYDQNHRSEVRRGWARSGADWNDHYRDDARRWEWNEQRPFYGRDDRGRAGWNRDWRRDSRYDWAGWRAGNRNAFRLPRYYAPYGWNDGYRRFGIGATLSSVLFSQNYWINDPWAYRLPEADGDFRWVRYYNDALLVDTYSGEVVDVITDIFW